MKVKAKALKGLELNHTGVTCSIKKVSSGLSSSKIVHTPPCMCVPPKINLF